MISLTTVVILIIAAIILFPVLLVGLDVLAIPMILLGKEIVLVFVAGMIIYWYLKKKGNCINKEKENEEENK